MTKNRDIQKESIDVLFEQQASTNYMRDAYVMGRKPYRVRGVVEC